MKNNKNLAAPANTTSAKNSLFDSILANEKQSGIDMKCQTHANRVGILLKVLYNRDLKELRTAFEVNLEQLCRDVANNIDNELSKTKEDC